MRTCRSHHSRDVNGAVADAPAIVGPDDDVVVVAQGVDPTSRVAGNGDEDGVHVTPRGRPVAVAVGADVDR
jgi:hypothetical protein